MKRILGIRKHDPNIHRREIRGDLAVGDLARAQHLVAYAEFSCLLKDAGAVHAVSDEEQPGARLALQQSGEGRDENVEPVELPEASVPPDDG